MHLNRAGPDRSLKTTFIHMIRHPTYQKAGMLLIISIVCFFLLYYVDNSKELKSNANIKSKDRRSEKRNRSTGL